MTQIFLDSILFFIGLNHPPRFVTMADANGNNHPAVNVESPDGDAIIDDSSIQKSKMMLVLLDRQLTSKL
jgi:hypothetical protein